MPPGFVRVAISAHPEKKAAGSVGGWSGSDSFHLKVGYRLARMPIYCTGSCQPLLISLWCKFSRLYHMCSGEFRREKCCSKGKKRKSHRGKEMNISFIITQGRISIAPPGSVGKLGWCVCVEVGWLKAVQHPATGFKVLSGLSFFFRFLLGLIFLGNDDFREKMRLLGVLLWQILPVSAL